MERTRALPAQAEERYSPGAKPESPIRPGEQDAIRKDRDTIKWLRVSFGVVQSGSNYLFEEALLSLSTEASICSKKLLV